MQTEQIASLHSDGWKDCLPGFVADRAKLGPCFAAPWDTQKLYAIPLRDALRMQAFALATGARYSPTCAALEAFELREAQRAHARMLEVRKGA